MFKAVNLMFTMQHYNSLDMCCSNRMRAYLLRTDTHGLLAYAAVCTCTLTFRTFYWLDGAMTKASDCEAIRFDSNLTDIIRYKSIT